MKHAARWLLRALTAAVPVFIAACYGPAYRYLRRGRVLDATTQAGVAGAKVSCVNNGAVVGPAQETSQDGWFAMSQPCNEVRVEDKSGAYQPVTVHVPPGDGTYEVPVDKAH